MQTFKQRRAADKAIEERGATPLRDSDRNPFAPRTETVPSNAMTYRNPLLQRNPFASRGASKRATGRSMGRSR